MNDEQLSKKLEGIENKLNLAIIEIHEAIDCAHYAEEKIKHFEENMEDKYVEAPNFLILSILAILFLIGFILGISLK